MIYVTEPCWVWSRYNKEGCVFHIVCTYFSIINRDTKKGQSFGLKTACHRNNVSPWLRITLMISLTNANSLNIFD